MPEKITIPVEKISNCDFSWRAFRDGIPEVVLYKIYVLSNQ